MKNQMKNQMKNMSMKMRVKMTSGKMKMTRSGKMKNDSFFIQPSQ